MLSPPSGLQNGLAVYVDFDESNKNGYDSYTDYTGGVNWGSESGATTGGGAFGSSGFNPDGSSPGTSSLGSAGISAQDFTVSFQFKDVTLSNNTWALRMTTSAGQTLQFEILSSNSGTIQLYVGGTNNGYVGATPDLTGTTSDWQTFTMTSSSSGIALYLNGEKTLESNKVLDAGTLNFFQLGCNNGGYNKASWKTDDFGLWNRVLSDAEIKFLASNPASTPMIPEPAEMGLLFGLFGLGLVASRRRRKNI